MYDKEVYLIPFDNVPDESIKQKLETTWYAVEKVSWIPLSFASPDGAFLFKISEDVTNEVDGWILVLVNKTDLDSFLNRKLTYGELMTRADRLFSVLWDIRNFNVKLTKELTTEEAINMIQVFKDERIL